MDEAFEVAVCLFGLPAILLVFSDRPDSLMTLRKKKTIPSCPNYCENVHHATSLTSRPAGCAAACQPVILSRHSARLIAFGDADEAKG